MKKIGIVITDGVGYRNFVLSHFLTETKKTFSEVIIFSYLPKDVYQDLDCKVIELNAFEEKFQHWFLRKLKEVAHLQLHKKNNFGITDNWKANFSKEKTNRGKATRFIYKITKYFHSEGFINKVNYWQQVSYKKHTAVSEFEKLIKNNPVDMLFFTHQRPPYIVPLVYVANKLKIKTVSFIFSWDNLASKGRMAARFDHYLVWSNLMKTELQHFYKSIKNEQITVVGTPQFEPYVMPEYEIPKADFISKFNLNENYKTICFSCGDISTSKNDELYIEIIAEAIQNQEIINVNFLIRTSPAEDPKRFETLVKKFPFIHWNFPKWNLSRENHQETWSQRVPTVEDIVDLRSILQYSDLNINMLSTMSLDFMQFDKPVINPVFGNLENGLYNDQRFLNYAHIETVINSKATKIVKNKEELIKAIQTYLDNPNLDSENRKKLIDLHVSCPLKGTGKRIATELKQ